MRTPITWVEKVVGVFVLLVVVAVVSALFMAARKQNIFGTTKTHVIHTFLETGAGVKEGTPIKLKGVDVGAVTDMKLVELSPVPGKLIKVDMLIQDDFWRFLPK